ncbi:hypothetical protein ACFO4L_02420 [Bacillus daqingensis]|uniref:Uncharacterized protein n=1 Tax=Bacillus daqingensis TaxID=872396 RepID=A0ABV9NRW4_9BACI
MKRRIPLILETDKTAYEAAVDNMISEGGPVYVIDDMEEQDIEQEQPIH